MHGQAVSAGGITVVLQWYYGGIGRWYYGGISRCRCCAAAKSGNRGDEAAARRRGCAAAKSDHRGDEAAGRRGGAVRRGQ